jgi:exopolysaccharide biosynthesis polyprenyl glycosylphosphotransferase
MESEISDLVAPSLRDPRLGATSRLGTIDTLRLGATATDAARPPGSRMLRDSIFRRMLLAADTLAITVAFLLTMALSSGSPQLMWAGIAGLPILLLGAKISGLYGRDDALLRKTTLDEAPKLFQVATMCALAAWLAAGAIVAKSLDRHQVLFLWLVLTVLLIVMRTAARAIALRIAPAERCLFIGDAASCRAIRSKLVDHAGINANLVAHLDLESVEPWSTDARSSTRLAEVRDLARELDIHRAIVAPRSANAAEVLDLVRTLKAVGVRVSVLPRLLEAIGSSVEFDELDGITVMAVRHFELTRSSVMVKRSFDLVCASILLLAVAPLMIAITAAIKLDSRGSIFFRQLRVGRHGKRFQIVKFRTMVPDAEALKDSLRHRNEARDGLFKIADDPRTTGVGRFLRKSALDEMPQLLNVLKGEMSLVGPRPLVVEEDLRVEGWHRRRLELTPGMTGHWQILGPTRVPLAEMVAMDYLYVANWSLWTDVKILMRTVPHVLRGRGS